MFFHLTTKSPNITRFFIAASLCHPLIAASMSGASSTATIKSVVVVGGTHGNEYTGVWCIKALERQKAELQNKFPTLDISSLMGNPKAHLMNKRFIDVDLNRQFTRIVLHNDDDNDDNNNESSVESLRAKEINSILGPKFDDHKPDDTKECVDVVIDLHSTTANMGMSLIVAEGDPLMTQAAAYVLHKCGQKHNDFRCFFHGSPKRENQPFLPSTGRYGFTVEVGPVPQGVLRHDAVEKTQDTIDAILEFLHRRNENPSLLMDELNEAFPTGHVPCFQSAKPINPKAVISTGGKIAWPCDVDNVNFPAWIVHKDIQDNDFQLIETGDPLFIDLDGNIIPYDGSFGSPVCLVFINEGGYYYESSGTGIGVAVATKYNLQTGKVIE